MILYPTLLQSLQVPPGNSKRTPCSTSGWESLSSLCDKFHKVGASVILGQRCQKQLMCSDACVQNVLNTSHIVVYCTLLCNRAPVCVRVCVYPWGTGSWSFVNPVWEEVRRSSLLPPWPIGAWGYRRIEQKIHLLSDSTPLNSTVSRDHAHNLWHFEGLILFLLCLGKIFDDTHVSACQLSKHWLLVKGNLPKDFQHEVFISFIWL